MKKAISIGWAAVAALCLSSCQNTQPQTTLEEMNIKGDVLSVTDSVFVYDDGKLVLESATCTTFNSDGQMVSQVERDCDGDICLKIVQHWSSRHERTDRIVTDGAGNVWSKSEYSYVDGRLSSEKKSIEKRETAHYSYDKEGRVAQIDYDRKGISSYSKVVYSYLDNLGSYIRTETDKDGHTSTETVYLNERRQIRSINTVDDQFYSYEFDGNGNVVRAVSGDEIVMYEYNYDFRKNWTKSVEYQLEGNGNRTPTLMCTRYIEYKD